MFVAVTINQLYFCHYYTHIYELMSFSYAANRYSRCITWRIVDAYVRPTLYGAVVWENDGDTVVEQSLLIQKMKLICYCGCPLTGLL